MKKLKKDQRGLTLIELVIAITITGIITAAITMAVFQVFTMNTRTSNHMAAVSQVQHAGKVVSEDILEAQNVDTEDDPDTPKLELVTLTWTDWATNYTHEVIYTLEDNELRREHRINSVLDSTTKVAEYIDPDPAETSCVPDGDAFIFTVTATVGEQSETREYEVKPRPGS